MKKNVILRCDLKMMAYHSLNGNAFLFSDTKTMVHLIIDGPRHEEAS